MSKAAGFNYGWVIVGAGALMTCIGMGSMMSLASSSADGRGRAGRAPASRRRRRSTSSAWASGSSGARSPTVRHASWCCAARSCSGSAWSRRARRPRSPVPGPVRRLSARCGRLLCADDGGRQRWFEHHRSLAVALVSAGMGVAPLTVAPIARWLIRGTTGASRCSSSASRLALLIPASLSWCARRAGGRATSGAPARRA